MSRRKQIENDSLKTLTVASKTATDKDLIDLLNSQDDYLPKNQQNSNTEVTSFFPQRKIKCIFYLQIHLRMLAEIIETWQINNRVNQMIITRLRPEDFLHTLSPRGRNVGQQFIHLHSIRLARVQHFGKGIYDSSLELDKDQAVTAPMLQRAFDASGKQVEALLEQCYENGMGRAFKRGLIPFLGYVITHEAHHRGSILLTLKKNGFKLPNELRWGIWEWSRI